MYAEVAIPGTGSGRFTYLVPRALEGILRAGMPVVAPLRGRLAVGMVMNLARSTAVPREKLREIRALLDPALTFSPELFELLCWLADYYICSPGEVFRAAYPPGTMARLQMTVEAGERIPTEKKQKLVYELVKNNPGKYIFKAAGQLIPGIPSAVIKRMLAAGFLYLAGKPKMPGVAGRLAAVICEEQTSRDGKLDSNEREAMILALLSDHPAGLPLTELPDYGISRKEIMELARKKRIEIVRKKVESIIQPPERLLVPPPLTADQLKAKEAIISAIDSGVNRAFLLYGVTGSGKTQVYIEAAKRVLSLGKSVLVLVPEISLTPQAISRFSNALGLSIGVWHSRTTSGQRFELYRKANTGELKVIIGVRSAVFAPLRDLGLIVIDEEQDDSYKQSDPAPRYNARDVGLMRARIEKAVVILGSATPSLESYYNALRNKFELLRLPHRVSGGPMPKALTINLKTAETARDMWPLSEPFIERVCNHVADGNQVILLLNRRGYSGMLICRTCGQVTICGDCKVAMTYHRSASLMLCHYCGASQPPPTICAGCGGCDFDYRSLGTQKLEELLRSILGERGIIRMDSDSTRRKGVAEKIVSDFESGQNLVLLGTKMVAKGHHFPKVGMVGVVLADAGLHLPDFRATEKVFALLVQAAGRAGRSAYFADGGEFVIQSFDSSSRLMEMAAAQDYESFFKVEIEYRRELGYPPFGKIIRCVISGNEDSYTRWAARLLAKEIGGRLKTAKILGPASTAVFRMGGKFHYQIMLKGRFSSDFKRWLADFTDNWHISRSKDVSIKIDVDPREMT